MEDINSKVPFFKKVDREVFDRLDKFKQTSNYTGLHDYYNALEEDQQKVFKGVVIIVLFLFPVVFLGTLWWQNVGLREDLEMRVSILKQANQILGQNKGLREVGPQVLSSSPIDSESMLTSRLSNLAGGSGVDLSKIQVDNYSSSSITTSVYRTEADIKYSNLSTDDLMNLLMAMMNREKFRVQQITINRNAETNFLQGQFHAIHFSSSSPAEGEED